MACGILVPGPGIEPGTLAVEAWSPNHWTTREFPVVLFLKAIYLYFKKIFKVMQNICIFCTRRKNLYSRTERGGKKSSNPRQSEPFPGMWFGLWYMYIQVSQSVRWGWVGGNTDYLELKGCWRRVACRESRGLLGKEGLSPSLAPWHSKSQKYVRVW